MCGEFIGKSGHKETHTLCVRVETGESEDVRTRDRLHCDGTGLCRAQI